MNKRILLLSITVLFFSLVSSMTAFAQRMIPGQLVLSLDGSYYDNSSVHLGLGILDYHTKIEGTLSFMRTGTERYTVGATKEREKQRFYFKNSDIYLSGGYHLRAFSTRDRFFNFWVGGSFDLGLRLHDEKHKSYGISKAKFIYGVSPKITIELFPLKTVSLYAYFKPRVQLYGHHHFEGVFYPEYGIGTNIYLFY